MAALASQTSLSVMITSVKGSVVKVGTSDHKTYTLAFAAKVSFVDEGGKNLALKQMRVGDSLRLSGTVKGITFVCCERTKSVECSRSKKALSDNARGVANRILVPVNSYRRARNVRALLF